MRRFRTIAYFTSISNLSVWAHFWLMSWGWVQLGSYTVESSQFSMRADYPVLNSPEDQTPARILQTNAAQEQIFLTFSQSLTDLDQAFKMYINTTGLCGERRPAANPCRSE